MSFMISSFFSLNLNSLILQFCLIVLLAIFYGFISLSVYRKNALAAWDVPFGSWLISQNTSRLDRLFKLVTELGTYHIIRLGTLMIGLWLIIFHRDWVRTLMFVVLFGATMVINKYLKRIYPRPRPHFPQNPLKDYSFPSGHTTLATAFYWMVAYLGWIYGNGTTLGWIILLLSFALVILIGFSRIYLGVHFMTDVVGGWIAGSLLFFSVLFIGNFLLFNLRIS
jgi:undecaprenyl-diphosphatase